MKNIKKIGGLLLTSLMVASCTNEPLSEYSSLRDFAYLCGTENNNNSPIVMQQNQQMSFLNMSQGAKSTTWTVPAFEESGIKFLGDEIKYFKVDDPETELDETTKIDYDAMIIDHAYQFADNKKAVHLFFTKTGSFAVNLRCVYDRPVSYTLYDMVLEKEITYYSKEVNGEHVIDKDITLFVMGDDLTPTLVLKYGDGEVMEIDMKDIDPEADPATYPTINLKYGDMISFSDTFTAEDIVDVRDWSCGNPVLKSTAAAPNFFFRPNTLVQPGIDTCKVFYEATRWETTMVPSEVSSGNLRIPVNIFVENEVDPIEVTASYLANKKEEYADKNLRLTVGNGQFDAESILNAKPEDFVVSYTNEAAGVVEAKNIAVTAIEAVNANSMHILNVYLAEPIYTSDVATLQYVGSDLKVLFNDTMTDFSMAEPLAISMPTSVEGAFNYDFENVENVESWKIIIPEDLVIYQPWPGIHSLSTLETEESGNHYISIEPDKQTYEGYNVYFVNTDTFAGKSGNNVLKGKIRVSESAKTDLNLFFPTEITSTTKINATSYAGKQTIKLSDTEAYKNGEWCEFEMPFTSTANITGYFNFELGLSQRGKVDLDDLTLTNYQARPTE